MNTLKPFLDDMLSMSTGTDGRTLEIHFSRPVTKEDRQAFAAAHNAIVRGQFDVNNLTAWRPIAEADKTITDVQDFPEAGITIKTSDRYWVRDEDGRVYEAAWSEGRYGRDYWWDFEGESPVDPVEFMPHPLDPRWADINRCATCDGTGMEARHQLCRDCDDAPAKVSKGVRR